MSENGTLFTKDASQLDRLGRVLSAVLLFLDESDSFALFLLVIVLYYTGQHFVDGRDSLRKSARTITFFLFVAYTAHLYFSASERPDAFELCLLLFRALLVSGVVLGASMIAGRILSFLWHYLVSLPVFRFKVACRALAEFHRKRKERRNDARRRRAAQMAPVVSREEYLRRVVNQAKRDYELDCELIRSTGLGDDEQEAALTQAKQKYLQRLSDAVQ